MKTILFKVTKKAGPWLLMPAILATQEAENIRMVIQSQPPANKLKKNPSQKKRAGEVAQVVKAPAVRPHIQTPVWQKPKTKNKETKKKNNVLRN
jgi:hypothetical protein